MGGVPDRCTCLDIDAKQPDLPSITTTTLHVQFSYNPHPKSPRMSAIVIHFVSNRASGITCTLGEIDNTKKKGRLDRYMKRQ